MKRILLTMLLLISLSFGARSQNFSNGCLVTAYATDRIYISSGGGSDYYLAVCNGQSPSNRFATPTGRLGAYRSCNDGYYYGYTTNYVVAQCPIDDYLPALLLGFAGIGVFVLRKPK